MHSQKAKRIICIILIAVLALSLLPALCFSDYDESLSYDEQMAALTEQKETATRNRINAQNKVEQLKEEQAAVIEEKIALEERNIAAQEEIDLILEQIELLKAEIAATEKNIQIKQREVDDAKQKEASQMEKYKARIRAMEENSRYGILDLIIGSESFGQLISALDDYGEIMESDKVLYNQLVEAREEYERIEQEFIDYKNKCEKARQEFENKQKNLEAEQRMLEKQIEESQALIDEYAALIEQAEKEQKAMAQAEANASYAAANFINEYNAAKSRAIQDGESGDGSSSSSGVQTYDGASGSGSYVWPFPGHYVITSPFGYRSSTSSYHTGVDIDGYQSSGSPIVAADSGTVILAEYYGGYGNCIIIDHGNGYSTLYAHLSSMNVGVGSSVSQGQTIGGVGNTGTCYGADGVHLHFEVIQGGTQVNPLTFLGGYSYTMY